MPKGVRSGFVSNIHIETERRNCLLTGVAKVLYTSTDYIRSTEYTNIRTEYGE